MTRHIYALLVGINDYAPDSRVNSLQGCVPDIQTVQAYVEDRVPPENRHILPLFNEQATRQAVIDAFRTHLCQAGSEDTVLFYYAGHGSQEDAPEEFWTIEPDRLNETLVLYDSRSPNGLDLADKELAVLIGEVAQKNPHIVIIFDSCHSGSGTRNVLQEMEERRLPKSSRKRPLESYLGLLSTAEIDSLKPESRSPDQNPGGWSLPRGRHVLMAACRDHETAKESPTDSGQRRGIFSRFLLQALTQTNGNLSYRDLFQQVNALVRGNIAAQSPQLEAVDPGDLDLPFLGTGAIAPREPYFTVSYNRELGWIINGGAIHGIAAPTGTETTLLALFPFNSATQREGDENPQPIGVAEVTAVQPQLSKISSTALENLDPKTTLKAMVTSQPLPPVGIRFMAATPDDEAGIELVRAALRVAGDRQMPSLYVAEEQNPDKAAFRLLAQAGEYLVTRPTDDRPLITQLRGYTAVNATEAVGNLEHIARWLKVVELQSPSSSRIPPTALQVEILEGEKDEVPEKVITEPQIRLEYKFDATTGKWKQPAFRVRLTNRGSETLFCALLDLTEQFEIDAALLPGGIVRLPAGETVWVNDGKPIYGNVPGPRWQQGMTEAKDILKMIACTTDFDATMMSQGELGQPLSATRSATRGGGTLNRLMQRVITRKLSNKADDEENYDDWIATQVTFTIVRPQAAAVVSTEAPVALGRGVTLQPHPTFKAKASLTTINQSTRDLGNHLIPPILRADSAVVTPFQFTTSRGDDPGLSVLELTEVDPQTRETVTPDNPLTLAVTGETLQVGEQLLALAYDGEFYLPVGTGKNKDNQLEISLERLPEPVSEGERSLQGSIKIFFQKLISKRLKFDFAYPLLSAVQVQPDGTVDPYDTVEVSVKERVAQANRIVLFIHGIIGDTESMVPAVQHAKLEVNGDTVPLCHTNVYDLVLAFDYENLNTSIADNARSLKQRLEAVGLGQGHGKTLHIVAHSMGGLVSRWFIEREGGKDIVNHLIMLGTPNNGSPWPNVVDFALPLLTVGLNGLAAVAWPVSAIGTLMHLAGAATAGAERQMTIALKEMQPNSTLVESLFSSQPPGIPYTVIAGNTSLIQPKDPATQAKITNLLQRVGKYVIEAPFMGIANDIAVTVNSITHLPERTPAPQMRQVACDHLTYFTNPIGLAALADAVSQALGLSGSGPVTTPPPPLSSPAQAVSDAQVAVASPEPGQLPVADPRVEPSQPQPVAESPSSPPRQSASTASQRIWTKVMAGLAVIVAIVGFWFCQQSQRENAPQPSNSLRISEQRRFWG
jgi:pimeloyl-ACP methyl ester carboxylesterase